MAFGALAVWILSDGRFAEVGLRSTPTQTTVPAYLDRLALPTPATERVFAIILGLAGLGAVGIVGGLFLGPPAHRRVRSWLAMTALVVVWLTLLLKWPALAWHGQAFRVERQIDEFRVVAASLAKDWPTDDGERANLGLFRAYPIAKPSVLLLMTQHDVPGTDLSFSAVERSDRGVLRFQLGGKERGAWLEWHPANDLPASYVGGLDQHYDVERVTALGDDWYLVRYK